MHAPGLKALEQATDIRRRVLTAFEDAEKETAPERKRALLTFVIVGGEPTGAVGEMSALSWEGFSPHRPNAGSPRILPAFDETLSGLAARDLEKLGVQIWSRSTVTHVDADGLDIGTERLQSRTVP